MSKFALKVGVNRAKFGQRLTMIWKTPEITADSFYNKAFCHLNIHCLSSYESETIILAAVFSFATKYVFFYQCGRFFMLQTLSM